MEIKLSDEQIEKLKQELSDIQNTINNEKVILAKLGDSKKELELEKKEISNEIENLNVKQDALADEISERDGTLNILETQVDEKHRQLSELESDVKCIEKEVERQSEKVEGIKTEIDSLTKTKQLVESELNKIKEQSLIANRELINTGSKKKSIESDIAELEKAVSESLKILAETNDKVELKQAELESLSKQTDTEIERAKTVTDNLEKEINDIKERKEEILSTQNILIEEATNKLAELQKQNEVEEKLRNDAKQMFINLSLREERLKEFCSEKGIDTSKF